MKVLFICEGNMMRSQMAEAFYNTLTGTNSAFSAGAMAALKDHIAERAKIVMDEISISTDGMRSDQLTEEMVKQAQSSVAFLGYLPGRRMAHHRFLSVRYRNFRRPTRSGEMMRRVRLILLFRRSRHEA